MRIGIIVLFCFLYKGILSQPESVDTDALWNSEKKVSFSVENNNYSDTVKVDKFLSALRLCDSIVYERYLNLRNDVPFVYELDDTTITWTFFDIADDIYFHDFDSDGNEDIFISYFHWGMGVMNNTFFFIKDNNVKCLELPVGKIIHVENWLSSVPTFAIIVPKSHVDIIKIDFKIHKITEIKKIETKEEYFEYIKK